MTFRTYLTEGGKALIGTSRINQPNAQPTIDDLLKNLKDYNITNANIAQVGSATKKKPEESSGDIDFVHTLDVDNKQLLRFADSLRLEHRLITGLKILSVKYPIVNEDGKQPNQSVQVDFIPVNDLNWAKWSYHSPSHTESKYSSSHRNEILFTVARYANTNYTKHINEEAVEWDRWFFDPAKGLMEGSQTRVGKRGAPIKTVKTVNKKVLTADPKKAVELLFGNEFDYNKMMSYEDVMKVLLSDGFKNKDRLVDILKSVRAGCLKKQIVIPDDLDK